MTQLFIVLADGMKCLPVSTQRISSWIMLCIRAYYDLVKIPAPVLTAPSKRAQASSAAYLAQGPDPGHL